MSRVEDLRQQIFWFLERIEEAKVIIMKYRQRDLADQVWTDEASEWLEKVDE